MPKDATAFGCPLLPLTGAMIGGIVLGYEWPDHRIWVLCGAVACFLVLSVTLYRQRPSLLLPLFLFAALGYLLIQPWAAPRFAPDHVTHFTEKGTYTIVGRVDTPPLINGHGQSFNLRTDYFLQDNTRIAVSGKLRVTISGDGPLLCPGDQIQFNGSIGLLRNFKNPGGFDYKRYMAAQGVWASTYARANGLSVLEKATGEGFQGVFDVRRRQLSEFLETATSKRTVGIFLALLLGDMGRLEESTRMAFQRTGIGHVLSISGLHVGIVGGTVFFLFSRLLAFSPWFLRRGWIKQGAAIFAMLAVWIYGLLSGMAPATQRSVYMICVFLGSFFVGRPHIMINAVVIAAILIFVYDPPSLFSISCQLSFAAVIAIVLGIPVFGGSGTEGETSLRAKAWRKIVTSVFISVSAFFGTLPLIMLCFQEVSTIGLISNLLFVPLIEMCVLPVGLFSLCLFPISPLLAEGILFPADRLLLASLDLVEKMASWPFASVITVSLSLPEVGCYYVGLLLLILYLTTKKSAGNEVLNPKRMARLLILGTVVLAIAIIDIGCWCYQRFWCPDLRVTVMDVGDGTATLLELPRGKTMLIDGGGFPDNSVFDVGKSVIAPFLLAKKIRTVDEIILSHPNSDHMNGLIFIADHFHVKRLRCNNETADTEGYRRLNDLIASKKIYVPEFSSEPRTEEINGVTFKFLYPPADYSFRKQNEKWRKENNNSVVVQACLGAHSFLFPGDIEAEAEAELVEIAGDELRSDVLIAPHHGSRTSGTIPFLKKVQPQRVIISTGARRRQIRPHPEALARYREVCPVIYCTANQGAVRFSTDGRRLREWVTE
jgi:competence protein ComEC